MSPDTFDMLLPLFTPLRYAMPCFHAAYAPCLRRAAVDAMMPLTPLFCADIFRHDACCHATPLLIMLLRFTYSTCQHIIMPCRYGAQHHCRLLMPCCCQRYHAADIFSTACHYITPYAVLLIIILLTFDFHAIIADAAFELLLRRCFSHAA